MGFRVFIADFGYSFSYIVQFQIFFSKNNGATFMDGLMPVWKGIPSIQGFLPFLWPGRWEEMYKYVMILQNLVVIHALTLMGGGVNFNLFVVRSCYGKHLQ